VRILATLGRTRSPFLPEMPTLVEQGFDIAGDSWYGLWAPAKTPAETVGRISRPVMAAMAAPPVRERMTKLGLVATGSSPEELRAAMRLLVTTWAPAIKASGFTMEQ
jgi:tripartite-type tricarboxylate transporter receptor subunit TctC